MNTWCDLSDLSEAARSKLLFFQIIISKKIKLCPSALYRTQKTGQCSEEVNNAKFITRNQNKAVTGRPTGKLKHEIT
jgi:hypothetical protein